MTFRPDAKLDPSQVEDRRRGGSGAGGPVIVGGGGIGLITAADGRACHARQLDTRILGAAQFWFTAGYASGNMDRCDTSSV